MFRLCVFVFGVFGLSWQVGGEVNKYENYTLMRIIPQTGEELQAVSAFKDAEGEVEMLKGSRGMNDSMDVLVPPAKMDFMKEFVDNAHVTYEIKQENYGRMFDSVDREPRRRFIKPSSFDVFSYHSYQKTSKLLDSSRVEILDFQNLIGVKYPDLVQVEYRGDSYQGRQIKLVKISTNPKAGNPIIFIDAGIHAREWVAPAMAVYLINRLTGDPEARKHELDGVDWYILPVVNPDGYEYTRTSSSNRMWRKTRSKNGVCYGVDANRNYGFKWGVSGVSKNPCDMETYAGPKPFSEPETRIVRKIMLENSGRMKLYVSLHSYGQYLVYPWGYTEHLLPKEWKKLHALAKRVSDAVQHAGGEPFRVLSAGKWYAAAGGSDDYAFGAAGAPYSYTMELTDGYEFVFPEGLLRRVLPEFYAGFRVFAYHIRSEFSSFRGYNLKGHGSGNSSNEDDDESGHVYHQTAPPPLE